MQGSLLVRALSLLTLALFVGCGSHDPTNFNDPDRGGAGGSGVTQGGSAGTGLGGSGAEPGGAGGSPASGAGGTAQGGSGAGGSPASGAGGTPSGGAGASTSGAAGTGLGGANAGIGGTTSTSGSSSGGSGARAGSGGTAPIEFSCGSLVCVSDRQYCVRTLPEGMGGPEMRMCLPFADSCATLNCDCFCKAPMNDPCGQGRTCMCSNEGGRINVVCTGN